MLFSQKANSQSYFRKYIDSDEHCHEFNNQVMLKGDSIYLMNFINCDSLSQPFSNLMHLDFNGDQVSSRNLPTIKTNYNSANLNGNSIFVAGTNNLNSPDSYFELFNIDIETEVSESISINLLDSTNNIYLNPIGSIHFGESELIYGQYQENDESTVKGFLLWLDEYFYKDSVMTFENDKDWSIISDAVVDNNDNIVILLEEVKIIENVEHHYRVIQKYNASKEMVFEWISEPFYSNQGQGNITVLNSGIVVIEYVSSENEYIHSLVAIDELGTIVWNYEFPLNEPYSVYRIFDLITSQTDDIILAGTYRNLDENIIITGYLAKLSKEGELLWERIFLDRSESGFDELNLSEVIQFQSITETQANDIIIGGRIIHSLGEPEENSDILFAITDSNGCFYPECAKVQDISTIGSFLDSTNVWIETYSDPFSTNKWSIKFSIDSSVTTINGKEYYEVLEAVSEMSTEWFGTNRFIRFENNIVYTPWLGAEIEMYNFNLMVNDTFILDPFQLNITLVVDVIDTIVLLNGEQRKRWKLRCYDDNPPIHFGYAEWVEGIGNINGLFATEYMCSFDGIGSDISCLYHNNELVYDNPELELCWYMTTSSKEIIENKVLVVPNPATDYINIIGLSDETSSIKILDVLGHILYQGIESNIQIENFPPGYYHLVCILQNHQFLSAGFLKL